MKKPDRGSELCVAASNADVQKVEDLLASGVDPNSSGDSRTASIANCTPLWLAVNLAGQEASESWAEFCDALTEVLPSIPKRDRTAKRQQYLNIIRRLLDAGVDVEMPSHGTTPLAQAVYGRDVEVVDLLLARGADPNAESHSVLSKLAKKDGRRTFPAYYNTPLHTAVQKSVPEIVEALLAAGANCIRADHEGRTPFEIAHEIGQREILELLEQAASKRHSGPT